MTSKPINAPRKLRGIATTAVLFGLLSAHCLAQKLVENLDRGVVAIRRNSSEAFVSWRLLGLDPAGTAFNVYRSVNGGTWTKLNPNPLTAGTNFTDTGYGSQNPTRYRVHPVIGGVEGEASEAVEVWDHYSHDIPLQRPTGGTTPDNVDYTYSPNDASVADLDGDGQYEIVLKWDPSNSKDNAHSGHTGNVLLDAYEMDGTFLWRIDLGINIRAGAHYTQFMVYDFDSDGRAEIVCKTADGTTDATGAVLGNPGADWRNSSGRILSGPEFLSAFDGETGAFIDTVNYVPARGNVGDWGDTYGNRVDRFLAGVAYLDGRRPSVVMSRGYYTRTVLAAWDLVDDRLVGRWVFDSDSPGNSAFAGQGCHSLSVADVDGDGFDEIIFGASTIDHDGTGMHSTGRGHGDALHVSDMDPDRPGLEAWMPHEGSASGATLRDAATGEILIEHLHTGDIGRGVAAHIDANHPGYQVWSYATGGVFNTDGTQISTNHSSHMMNFLVWWTGNLQREFLSAADGAGRSPIMERWNGSGTSRSISLYSVPTQYDTKSINGTKANPCLSGDILGDWREEIIYHSADDSKLRIFSTTEPTSVRIPTLMHDPQYRVAMAWQNVGYNQPPHPGFYIGEGMVTPVTLDVAYVGNEPPAEPGDAISVKATLPGVSLPDRSSPVLATSAPFDMAGGNAVVLLFTSEGGTGDEIGVTFAGQQMVSGIAVSDSGSGAQHAKIFHLIDPPTTSGRFVISSTNQGTTNAAYSAISLANVERVAGTDGVGSTATGGTISLLTATAKAGGFVVGAAANNAFSASNPPPSFVSGDTSSFLLEPTFVNSSGHLHSYGPLPSDGVTSNVFGNPVQRNAYALLAFEPLPLDPAGQWRLTHFETTEDSGDAADEADPDGDGTPNWAERALALDPNDPNSSFRLAISRTGEHAATLVWPNAPDVVFTVQSSATLSPPWSIDATIPGSADPATLEHPIDTSEGTRFYRIGIDQP